MIVLNPVQDQTLPRMRPNRSVVGCAIQFTSSEGSPIDPKKAGTNPTGASIVKPRRTPITMSGVTIPRKINDLIIEDPRTLWRRTASTRPVNNESGRWMTIQSRLVTRVPEGGPPDSQVGLS